VSAIQEQTNDLAIFDRITRISGLFLHRVRDCHRLSDCARITPHDEFALIRDNVPGAAIALGLSLLGFALPVASVIAHTENLIDCMIWSLIALIVQVIVYFVVRIPIPNLGQRIAAGDLAPAIWLGLASLAAGALSAASISY
jgi:putative membrane protein